MTEVRLERTGDSSFSVLDRSGAVVAEGCFGIAARVPGHDYDEGPIDFTATIRDHDAAREVLELVICEVQRRWKRRVIRTTVSAFDEPWIHVLRTLRFQETELTRDGSGREFVVFIGR
jgi:hypothetical protein